MYFEISNTPIFKKLQSKIVYAIIKLHMGADPSLRKAFVRSQKAFVRSHSTPSKKNHKISLHD